jgi:hypothetical protein
MLAQILSFIKTEDIALINDVQMRINQSTIGAKRFNEPISIEFNERAIELIRTHLEIYKRTISPRHKEIKKIVDKVLLLLPSPIV